MKSSVPLVVLSSLVSMATTFEIPAHGESPQGVDQMKIHTLSELNLHYPRIYCFLIHRTINKNKNKKLVCSPAPSRYAPKTCVNEQTPACVSWNRHACCYHSSSSSDAVVTMTIMTMFSQQLISLNLARGAGTLPLTRENGWHNIWNIHNLNLNPNCIKRNQPM